MARRHDDEREYKWSQPRRVYNEVNRPEDPGLDFEADIPENKSRTDQSQAADCDVNTILKRFMKTGILPGTDARALYADLSDAVSFHEAQNIIVHANEQFNALDPYVRARFENDPAKFLEFVGNPENAQEMIKLGLAALLPETDTDRLVGALNAANSKLSDAAEKKV